MKIDKSGIGYRVLVPVFLLVLVISLLLLGLIHSISDHIREDYLRFAATSSANNAVLSLELAAAELTAARLTGNPIVVEAKKQTVLDTITRFWSQSGQHGVIRAADASMLFSTLPPTDTALIIAGDKDGYHHVEGSAEHYHCYSHRFPLWGWTVTTVIPHSASLVGRKEVLLLMPIVAAGAFLIIGGLLLILRRNLQQPVGMMVDAVSAGADVPKTGVAEFDRVGGAVNDALAKIREHTDRLARELEERKLVEAVMRRQEKQVHLLLDSTAEGIYGVDTNGICTFCNPSCLRILGFASETELLGKNMHEKIHSRRADGTAHAEKDCRIYQAYQLQTGVHIDDEVFQRSDGSLFPVECWSYPIIEQGVVSGAVVAFFDITERKRAETELREERNKFEAIIATMGEGLSIQDRNFRVLYQNEVHKRFVGSHFGEFCYEAYQSKANPCSGCPVILAFEDGQVHTVERVRDFPGGMRHFEVAASPLRNAAGEIVAGIELVRDVTERKRTEQQLQQAHKMEAIGQLAGGVAHDFNNILTAITGYASFLKVKTEEGSQLRYYGEQILHAAEKAANLTRQILAFSRKQVISPRLVRINEIIQGMEKMVRRLIGEDIEIRLELADQDTTVMADPGQVEQVLLNLATNGRDAMPAGGSLLIKTEITAFDEPTARNKGLGKSGAFVLISVSDTGEGMTEKVRQRIFEPFFTTKELGRGTGLGLSIVYGIVTQHEGQISVYSEPGEGTTFRIYLPHAPQASASQVRQEEANISGKGETILVAEDDEAVRSVARLTLEEAGYRVILAVDGEDAVHKFREHEKDIQLCLFDLIMPKKNGKAALEEVRSLRRDMRALFMSGYAADIIRSKDLAEQDIEVTDKPLVPQNLLKRIRALLDGPPPGAAQAEKNAGQRQ